MAGPVVSTLQRRLCPITAGNSANVQRVRRNRHRYGCIIVPLSHFVGHAESAPVGGGPKPCGRYATQDKCCQARGGRFSATWGVCRWMECDAPTTRLQHFPCCCGGLRWTVTHEFCGSSIIEEFCRGVTSFGGYAVWRGTTMGDMPSVVYLMDAKAGMPYELRLSTSLCVRQRPT